MTKRPFQKIGLIGRARSAESIVTLVELKKLLLSLQYDLVIEHDTAVFMQETELKIVDRKEFSTQCDLAIVVGGDGSMLSAAKAVVHHPIPIIGINRGHLGFLTDIHPHELAQHLIPVLDGHYISETRFLIQASVVNNQKIIYQDIALNDVVLLPGDYAHMIEFSIFINDELVCLQKADGQIIATPTGSTAYALSGGGPILHPSLDALVLVPMFSHTLSSRPIVVNSNSKIKLNISNSN